MKYFSPGEFSCECGCGDGYSQMDKHFLESLDQARCFAGIPFALTSAYRCENHNKNVGGVPDSAHTKGQAVDISAHNSREKYIIINALLRAGFTRIGVAKTFIHVDGDSTKAPRVIWTY